MDRKIRFGVNYTPSKNWYYLWDEGKTTDGVEEDFAAISEAGLDHIRLQLRWDVFQKDVSHFSSQAFAKLEQILDTAKRYRLDVELCAFTGWLSGFWFLPDFLRDVHIIRDREAITAECIFLASLASAFASHKALLGIDLGNEINMYAGRPGMDFSTEEGDEWYTRLYEYCREKFVGKDIVLGVDHQPYFSDVYFSRRHLNRCGTATPLHTWSKFTGALSDGGILGAKTRYLALMNCELAVAYMEDPCRKIHLQEFGVSEQWASKEQIPTFVAETVQNGARCANVTRFTYWCSHNVNQNLKGFDALEYDLGLFDCNNRIKAQGEAFASVARKMRNTPPDERPKTAIVLRGGGIKNGKPFGWYYGEPFILLAERGISPAFILPERMGDAAYLAARNIQKIVEAEEI